MIELQSNSLEVSFPELPLQPKVSVEIQRTLRIPDDGKDYPLPPGLGALVNAVAAESSPAKKSKGTKGAGTDKTVADWFDDMTPAMRSVFDSLEGYLTSLGDDVPAKILSGWCDIAGPTISKSKKKARQVR
jgi:hypothetical protein